MIKPHVIIVVIYTVVSVIAGVLILYGWRRVVRRPTNSPTDFLRNRQEEWGKPVVVCIGDSLTHGTVSANYVDLLAQRPGMQGYRFINAGINGQLAYNVLQRLDEVVRCRPAIVTLLIGTNDVNSRMCSKQAQRYVKSMGLPRLPDARWFEENLSRIAEELLARTQAKIAFLSLPTMGENPGHPAFIEAEAYSVIIKRVAEKQGVGYLPLHETMAVHLSEHPPHNGKHALEKTRSLMVRNIVRRYFFGIPWDRTARDRGFRLHIDCLHLSDAGAKMVADLIEGFIA